MCSAGHQPIGTLALAFCGQQEDAMMSLHGHFTKRNIVLENSQFFYSILISWQKLESRMIISVSNDTVSLPYKNTVWHGSNLLYTSSTMNDGEDCNALTEVSLKCNPQGP